MTDFGGFGGCRGGVALDEFGGDLFVQALNRALGDRMRAEPKRWPCDWYADDSLPARVYSAMGNVTWQHDNGDTASYSFRCSGDIIAAIIGKGDYLDWYCCRCEGVVEDEIAEAMAKEGWRPVEESE